MNDKAIAHDSLYVYVALCLCGYNFNPYAGKRRHYHCRVLADVYTAFCYIVYLSAHGVATAFA